MRLASIHTYPIKGCHRVDQDRAQVQPWGLAGDRRWIAINDAGHQLTLRQDPHLVRIRPRYVEGALSLSAAGHPDLAVPPPEGGESLRVAIWRSTVTAVAAGPVADEWLCRVLDRKVRLLYLDDPTRRPVNPKYGRPDDRVSLADGYPLLLTNEASLATLNDWIAESGSVEGPLPMTRFRPNVVVSGAQPWAEDDWPRRRVRIGSVPFRVAKPCDRCVVTATDQENGERGREPLRTLARHRHINGGLQFGVYLIPDATGEIALGDPVTVLDRESNDRA